VILPKFSAAFIHAALNAVAATHECTSPDLQSSDAGREGDAPAIFLVMPAAEPLRPPASWLDSVDRGLPPFSSTPKLPPSDSGLFMRCTTHRLCELSLWVSFEDHDIADRHAAVLSICWSGQENASTPMSLVASFKHNTWQLAIPFLSLSSHIVSHPGDEFLWCFRNPQRDPCPSKETYLKMSGLEKE